MLLMRQGRGGDDGRDDGITEEEDSVCILHARMDASLDVLRDHTACSSVTCEQCHMERLCCT